uniref:hypothetical protein n=1 Tax=Vibrio cholerae TaxID=666 RepID=UPI000A0FF7A3|nr:hypothetical protein [Vibrio cholerae]ORP61685.1 hypothetical protein B7954_05225 [Vibrio cholerae]
MDLLEEINNIGELRFKEYKALKSLNLNTKYKIERFEKMKDKYGPTIIVELENCKVHLPKRFISIIDDKTVKELNKKDLNLIITDIKTFDDKETVLVKFE